MKPLWIELVNTGVANRFSFQDKEIIELNWRLTKYPSLYYNVFQHEIGHESGDYKAKDLIHDMKSRTPGLHKFMIMNPSSWNQVLPFYWDRNRKQIVYDISAITLFSLGIIACVGIFYGLGWLL